MDERYPEISELVGRGTMFSLDDSKGIIAQRNGNGAMRVYAALRTFPTEGDRPDLTLAGITKADLLTRFPGWHRRRETLSNADRIAAVRQIVALPPGLRWQHHSHLTLVGDAAHVMPPLARG